MGDQGPCGPCSEIHDLRTDEERAAVSGRSLVNRSSASGEKYGTTCYGVQPHKGSLEKLPSQHVDTGMGLSVYAWLCNVTSNYDTDVFTPLIKKWDTGLKYTQTSKK
jgi:alanyl-tRNA synthetase